MRHEDAKQLEVLIININAFERCELLNNIRYHGWESFLKCVKDRTNYLSKSYTPSCCELILGIDAKNNACYLTVKHIVTGSKMFEKELLLVKKTKP